MAISFNAPGMSPAGRASIADGAIGTAQLADGSITSSKLAAGAVSIADGAITDAKLADDAVSADKLASDAVVTASVVDGAITDVKLADDSVNADKLASDAVVTDSVVDGAITSAKIADGDVTATKIASEPLAVGITSVVASADLTATVNTHVYVDTAATTITLPASPTIGQRVLVTVGDFTDTVVARNGSNIMSSNTDMTLDAAYLSIQLIYTNATVGWVIA